MISRDQVKINLRGVHTQLASIVIAMGLYGNLVKCETKETRGLFVMTGFYKSLYLEKKGTTTCYYT